MDIGALRGVFTAVLMVAFVGTWIWAYSARRARGFDVAARIPLEEDTPVEQLPTQRTPKEER